MGILHARPRYRRVLAILLAGCCIAPAIAAPAQDYRQAYNYALRCYAVTATAKDEAGAHRSFDAAMKLGRLQNLSNRQLNADIDAWEDKEAVRTLRDPTYKAQRLEECRKLGLAT